MTPGKPTTYASSDVYIYQLLADPAIDVQPNGKIWSAKKPKGIWREVGFIDTNGYRCMAYKRKFLQFQRIMYAKFVGELNSDMVIDHIDDNKLNNIPSNLRMIPHRENARKHLKQYAISESKRKERSDKIMALIEDLLYDGHYKIHENGELWTDVLRGKKPGKDGEVRQYGEWHRAGMVNDDGYWSITYKHKTLLVSNIIYRAFNGNLDPRLFVDHINGDRSDDRPENLQQITQRENSQKQSTAKLNIETAAIIKKRWESGESQYKLAEEYGVSRRTISFIVRDLTWQKGI